MKLSSPKLKNVIFFFEKLFIFQEGTCKARKTKISYISRNETFYPQN